MLAERRLDARGRLLDTNMGSEYCGKKKSGLFTGRL
jgi:hypothetical protein